jgi:cytochrome c oxidase cbb3-type subunit 2
VPGSIMPAFPFLFEIKPKAEQGDRVVSVPKEFAPANGEIVATPAALDLAKYLLAMNHTYPVVDPDIGSR